MSLSPSDASGNEAGHVSPKWLRPCNMFELVMDKIQSSGGIMITCYCLTINSAAPVKKEHVEQALKHLYRKVPTLRLCIRPRQDEATGEAKPWVVEMDQEAIDFEVIPEESLEFTL